jgi:hypothetical protein
MLSFAIFLGLSPAFLTAQAPPRGITVEPIRVQKKYALVIGNQSYPKSPLKNPVNDAAPMAKALRGLGFDVVVEKKDLNIREMRVEIDRFSASLQPGDLALFYYAGHGVQANEQNYLIPVDFDSVSEADLPYDAYPATQVRDKLEQSGARLRILILDACRNNPFRSKRDGVRGLSPMASSVEGTFIAYATADNGVADDNPKDNNGLFTKSLLNAMLTSGLNLKQVFEKAKEDVYNESQKRQRPYTYDGVIGQFFFGPVTIVNRPVVSSSDLTVQEEIAYWNGVDKSDSESLDLYLRQYPNGRYGDLARRNLVKMAATSTATPKNDKTLNQPPAGFTALFNGKDLSGWRGRQGDFDPRAEAAFAPAERTSKQAEWNRQRDQHWRVDETKHEIVADGQRINLATVKDYGDFELYVDWQVSRNADSGIYLRGYAQVQIWDPDGPSLALGSAKGSGGLFNNSPQNPGKWPLLKADNPVGQWNTLHIKMVGSQVWVWLNDSLVVDGQVLENFFDRNTPLLSKGPIELQGWRGAVRFRNIYIRELQ